jgi:hypothetical protein
MKAILVGGSVVVGVILAVGVFFLVRGGDGRERTSYAAQLATLCVDSRKQVEALGKPSDIPISTLYPGTARIGRAFVKRARALHPPAAQAAQARTIVQQFGLYYDGLVYAYQFLTAQNNEVAFVRIVDGALANLARAEAAAKAIGSTECAVRPFE